MFCGKWFFLIQVGVLRNTPIPYIVVINFAEAAFRPKPKNYSVHFYIDQSYPVQFQTDKNEPLDLTHNVALFGVVFDHRVAVSAGQ